MDENGILFMDDENVVPFWLIHDGAPYSAATDVCDRIDAESFILQTMCS